MGSMGIKMSKSLKRVKTILHSFDPEIVVLKTELAKTAPDAARAVGCEVDQIAKSIIFKGEETGHLFLFVTAGAHRVDMDLAQGLAGEPLGKADAQSVRQITGFAIGGVSPVGHLTAIHSFVDERLFAFASIFAAAGTPHHVFECYPETLLRLGGGDKAAFSTPM